MTSEITSVNFTNLSMPSIPYNCWVENQKITQAKEDHKVLYCPKMEYSQACGCAHLKAMAILRREDVQDIFLEHPCPNGSPGYVPYSQKTLLSLLTKYPTKGRYLNEQVIRRLDKFFQELEGYNENIYPTASFHDRLTKSSTFANILSDKIDFFKLVYESKFPNNSTMIKVLKSITEINLAKPGDKDVAVVIMPNVRADGNGLFGMSSMINEHSQFLREISVKYPIHFDEASNFGEFNEVMKKIKKTYANIKIININGHGSADEVQLGSHVKCEARRNLLDNIWTYKINPQYPFFVQTNQPLPIDSDGIILLRAYSLEGGIEPYNLVNKIAKVHPGVTVLGLKEAANPIFKVVNLQKNKFSVHDINNDERDISYRVKARLIPADSFYNSAMLWLRQITGMRSWATELKEVK